MTVYFPSSSHGITSRHHSITKGHMIPPSAAEPARSSSQFPFSLFPVFFFCPRFSQHCIAWRFGLAAGDQVYGGAPLRFDSSSDLQIGKDGTVRVQCMGGRLFYIYWRSGFGMGAMGGQEDMPGRVRQPGKHWGDGQHEYTPYISPLIFRVISFGCWHFLLFKGPLSPLICGGVSDEHGIIQP
jgi:hypothetical protein